MWRRNAGASASPLIPYAGFVAKAMRRLGVALAVANNRIEKSVI
jgi:hypothetical protein